MEIEPLKAPLRDHRIAARVTEAHKSLFERAAILRGLSLTDFIVNAAYDAAVQTLTSGQIILELGPEDSRVFVEQLLTPREPDELPELQKAIRLYQQHPES